MQPPFGHLQQDEHGCSAFGVGQAELRAFTPSASASKYALDARACAAQSQRRHSIRRCMTVTLRFHAQHARPFSASCFVPCSRTQQKRSSRPTLAAALSTRSKDKAPSHPCLPSTSLDLRCLRNVDTLPRHLSSLQMSDGTPSYPQRLRA